MKLFITLILTLIIAIVSVRLLIGYAVKQGLVDIPNARSSHDVPTPRGGGMGLLLAIGVGVLIAAFWALSLPNWSLWVGGLIIAVVGYIDDRQTLPVSIRLTIQVLVAGGIYWITGGFQNFPLPPPANGNLAWLAIPFNVIWVIGVINIFNFLDGIDGYAGTQALIAGAGLALISHGTSLFVPALIIAVAALGFLVFNWHPARIFMGDMGSATLGFLFACLPFYAGGETGSFILVVILLLWFFLADGAFTLIRRAIKGEKVWEAHRSHLYQRLVISGLSHSRVVVIIMSAEIILLAFTQLCLLYHWSLWYPLMLALLLFGAFWGFTHYREKFVYPSY